MSNKKKELNLDDIHIVFNKTLDSIYDILRDSERDNLKYKDLMAVEVILNNLKLSVHKILHESTSPEQIALTEYSQHPHIFKSHDN